MDALHQPRPTAPRVLVYRFGDFTLDSARGALSRPAGKEVSLRPKTAEVLRYLAENAGRVVPRQEPMQAVWRDVFVTNDRITQCVTEIRRALGRRGARLLQTLPKRGYFLAAEVARAPTLQWPTGVC
jgi:adenylate cyclase